MDYCKQKVVYVKIMFGYECFRDARHGIVHGRHAKVDAACRLLVV